SAKDGLPTNDIRALYADAADSLWIGTSRAGLVHFTSGTVVRYTTANGLSNDHVLSIFKDSAGSLWVGTAGGGVNKFSGGKFSQFAQREGLNADDVWAIAEDGERSVWVGTAGGGLNRFRDGSFLTYGKQDGLSTDVALGVYQDREGAVWIGTDSAGVTEFKNGKHTRFTTRDGLSDNQVFSVTEDGKGDHWFGTLHGLTRLHQRKFAIYTTQDGLPDDLIRCTYTDSKGGVWVGTRGGVSHFDGKHFVTYGRKEGLSNAHVLSIQEDPRDHTLWVGTAGGLNHFVKGRFKAYREADGLSNDVIWAIYAEPDGTLWLGTNGGGLDRFKNGRFALVMQAETFDDALFQILDDERGNLWMSSNRAVVRISKAQLRAFADGRAHELTPRIFGMADGMRSGECNGGFQPAGWRLRDGSLAFPTMKGVAAVNPARLITNRAEPHVIVERVEVDKHALSGNELLAVPPGKGQLEFQYTATSFIEPGKIRFKYILDGFDKDWTDAGTRRTAYYTNIPPGQYTFRVMASNADGVRSRGNQSVSLVLRPHFYQTFEFDAIAILAGLALLVVAYRVRVGQLQSRQRKLEGLVLQRTEALAGSERKFRELAETIHEVFWILDPDSGAFLYVSPAFDEIWGFPTTEILKDAETWLACVHPDDCDRVRAARTQQRAGTQLDCEYRIVHGERTRWLWDRAFPITDESGHLIRVVGVVEEVTERKEAEQLLRRSNAQLEERVGERTRELIDVNEALRAENLERRRTEEQLKTAMQAAEAASRAKSEFLANMSHELRTPINGILGMTELALAAENESEYVEYLGNVTFSGNWLLRIIDDILDFSKGEARKLTLQKVAFDLRRCLNHALATLSVRAAEKGLDLKLSIEANVPDALTGDPYHLRRILLNLLDNAVKFTSAGSVCVAVRQVQESGSDITLEFCVSDTGIGIPEEKHRCIFEAFTQADGSSTREFGGTGLGLAICSQLVALMDGQIRVESEAGRGSQFYFTAKFQIAQQSVAHTIEVSPETSVQRKRTSPENEAPGERPLRILLVEDNPINQRLAVRLLQKNGHSVTVAGNGREALELVKESDSGFDCVLMDIQMPEMDGLETTRRIRAMELTGSKRMPIFALTAHATEHDKQLCLDAGMDLHLTKPIQTDVLLGALRRISAEAAEQEVIRF
ncbi:MAG: response regulator, partial [Acidobacteriaceae bacterium]|nr:response regulator [Acidobacteriaceae bacterium]